MPSARCAGLHLRAVGAGDGLRWVMRNKLVRTTQFACRLTTLYACLRTAQYACDQHQEFTDRSQN